MREYLRHKFFHFKMSELIWFITVFLILGFVLGALQYTLFDPSMVARRRVTNIETYPWVFIHVTAGMVWIISALAQCTDYILNRPLWHRRNGYLCFATGMLSMLALIIIHLKLQIRSPFGIAVVPSSIYTIVCLISGLIFIKQKKVEHHRAWMLRSLVFAMLMTIDRLDTAAHIKFGSQMYSPVHMTWFIYFVIELIIHRKLEWPILSKTRKALNVALVLSYISLGFTGGWLTYYFQFNYLNKTLPPYGIELEK